MSFSYKKCITHAIFMFFISCNAHIITWVKDPYHNWYTGQISPKNNNSYNDPYPDYGMGHHTIHHTFFYNDYSSSHSETSSNNLDSSSSAHDYLKELSFEKAQEIIAQNRRDRNDIQKFHGLKIIHELNVPREQSFKIRAGYILDSTIILMSVHTTQDLVNALSNPITRARLERLKYTYEQKRGKEKQIIFLDALLSGKITQLLINIQHPDITVAEEAINELKDAWPWERSDIYLFPKQSKNELKFITALGINIIKIAERDFITNPAFIEKYVDTKSMTAIENYKNQCVLLQKKGNLRGLSQETKRLEKIIKKNHKKPQLANSICLAIAQKTLHDPITQTFHIIIRTRHIRDAADALIRCRNYIVQQAQNESISRGNINEWSFKKYGSYVIEEMQERYKLRYDYIDTPIQHVALSPLSECLSPILYNIQDRKLPEAYNELIHCNSHVSHVLAEENITDPQAQKEFLIKNFDADVPEVAHNVYENRADHQNLCKNFIPVNVSYTAATILNNNDNCEVIAHLLGQVSEQVISNAQLCQLDYVPEIQDHIIQSLHVIREPKNTAELIFHVTMVDHILTDIQCQTNAMVIGKPTLWERSPDLLFRALVSFASRLDPLTQLQDIGSLFVGAGTLLGNRALDIIKDPITTTKNSVQTTLYVIDFISTLARLTSDTLYGIHYLSTQECQQRLGRYGENLAILSHVIDKAAENLTAEQVADATGHIAGDIVFAMGAPAVATFLKEIDALGKISNEAKVIARAIKSVAEEHPAYATAEGIVLKMGGEIKDIGNTAKIVYNSIVESIFLQDLKPIGNNIWQSPVGIIYGEDKKFGNTINHMLAHMTPNPMKNNHTVFNIPKDKIMKLIDEAWILKGDPLAFDPHAYLVDMKKIIGTKGETTIRIIVKKPGTCELLTAYPVTT